jgi:hypothetical protein
MFVALEIHARPAAPLLEVPEVALQPGNRLWKVCDGKLRAVGIRVVQMDNQRAVLLADGDTLAAGDRVVISPLAEPKNGLSVQERRQDRAPRLDASNVADAREPSLP